MAREAWQQRGGVPETPQALNRYAYARNNPLRFTDPTGHWIESALDIAFIAYDLYDISQNGLTWENGLALAADVGGLVLPGLTGGGALVRAVAHADDVADAARYSDEAPRILFGQARVDPTFSTKPEVPEYLKGRRLEDVAADLKAGVLQPDDIPIQAFEHEGQLVAANNRGLTTLSLAGMKPTNIIVRLPTRYELKRLSELSVLGDRLPSTHIAIMPHRADHRILRVVYLPE